MRGEGLAAPAEAGRYFKMIKTMCHRTTFIGLVTGTGIPANPEEGARYIKITADQWMPEALSVYQYRQIMDRRDEKSRQSWRPRLSHLRHSSLIWYIPTVRRKTRLKSIGVCHPRNFERTSMPSTELVTIAYAKTRCSCHLSRVTSAQISYDKHCFTKVLIQNVLPLPQLPT